ncbi:hypothetical protein MesoLj113a_44820 [Mesorhizobium sp. 113-1-2]|uniref:outer membrane protein n=1 Tax=Mesorhizobium sp. 113-1-2 TaxID=2744515 RepID=UPI000819980F|nr:hypothetical protein [Mesorhizobium sp. 113-1-2]BAV45432.1 Uncharacterized protein MLTONO_0529 [Mesorhizobium loti]BCG73324.1 hypothetical protein MesoLj113a_44820 [Mesorhizobium sp. 113-1-2]
MTGANMRYQIRQVQAVWPNGKYKNYRLHCFADAAAAAVFRDHFCGEVFDAKRDRENGKIRGVWRREYLHVDLGKPSFNSVDIPSTDRIDFDTVRVGINYHF